MSEYKFFKLKKQTIEQDKVKHKIRFAQTLPMTLTLT